MKTRLLTPLLRKSGLVLAFSALSSLPLMAADPATILPDDSVAYMEMDSAGFYKLENHPVTKAILAKHVPAIVQNDQINQARGMSLKALQPYSDESLSDAVLEAIDKDLATVPAPKP